MSSIPELAGGKTRRSVRNSVVGLSFFAVTMLLQFISRKVFIDYLGTDILGLNSMTVSLLEFLNMAELGIGAAVGISIYGPLAKGDSTSIQEILGIHRNLYRKVALIITVSAIILSFFFPFIYAKSGVPLWYAYSTFGVMLFSALAGYVWNYRQVLLSASQQEYKVQIAYRLPKCIQVLLQILCIVRWPAYGYQLWLILEVAGTMVATLLINRSVDRSFPEWRESTESPKVLKSKYPEVIGQVKQLMFHRIGGFLVRQLSPLLVYAYLSLEVVAVYGNYILIIMGINRLMEAIFRGQEAFIGHSAHTSDIPSQQNLFKEYFSLRFYLAAVCTFLFFVCVNPFIILWVGKEYLLTQSQTILISLILFFNILRGAVEVFLVSRGQTGDIWAPIVEGGVAAGGGLLLGYFFGLDGILGGLAISQALFIVGWKPFYLLRYGLGGQLRDFYVTLMKLTIWALMFGGFVYSAFSIFPEGASAWTRILEGFGLGIAYCILLGLILKYTDSGFGRFVKRVGTLLSGYIKK